MANSPQADLVVYISCAIVRSYLFKSGCGQAADEEIPPSQPDVMQTASRT